MKRTVHYKLGDMSYIKAGQKARVYPVDHTSQLVSNTTLVLTSEVRVYDKTTGVFETENSVYIPQ